jgi:hypothetical protein
VLKPEDIGNECCIFESEKNRVLSRAPAHRLMSRRFRSAEAWDSESMTHSRPKGGEAGTVFSFTFDERGIEANLGRPIGLRPRSTGQAGGVEAASSAGGPSARKWLESVRRTGPQEGERMVT